MLKSKTLFLVGAGASFEVGLPVGDDLKSDIARLLDIRFDDGFNRSSGDPEITEIFRTLARLEDAPRGGINSYLYKAWRIRDALPTAISIDNFLDAHCGDHIMENCGKLAIVRSILQAESGSLLKDLGNPGHRFSFSSIAKTWYIPLFQMFTENVRKADLAAVANKLSFIIFNYDRCIEHFIPYALSNYYDISIAEAEEIASAITFIHPYGQVGFLPWQRQAPDVGFGAPRCDYLAISQQIRTFTEGLADQSLGQRIQKAMFEAETVVSMGFAFHPINMELIAPRHTPLTRRVFGTTFGLSKADEDVVRADILRILRKEGPEQIHFPIGHEELVEQLDDIQLQALTCADFMRQFFRSIGASSNF